MKMFALLASACFLLLIISKPSVTVLSDEATPTPVSFVEVAK